MKDKTDKEESDRKASSDQNSFSFRIPVRLLLGKILLQNKELVKMALLQSPY